MKLLKQQDGPWFHFDNLSEADVIALSKGVVPKWVQRTAAKLIDYSLSDLKANADKPIQGKR